MEYYTTIKRMKKISMNEYGIISYIYSQVQKAKCIRVSKIYYPSCKYKVGYKNIYIYLLICAFRDKG